MRFKCAEVHEIAVERKGGYAVADFFFGFGSCFFDGCADYIKQSLCIFWIGGDIGVYVFVVFHPLHIAIILNAMKKAYAQVAGVVLFGGYFLYCALTPAAWHFIDNANLIFHEAGHAIFIFFGQFISIAMGSGLQIFLPLGIAAYFFYKQQKFEGSITLMWAGQNIINVSVYAADAVAMRLPLLGGDAVMHDWHYLLSATNLLSAAPVVAGLLYTLGAAAILAGIGLGFYFVISSTADV